MADQNTNDVDNDVELRCQAATSRDNNYLPVYVGQTRRRHDDVTMTSSTSDDDGNWSNDSKTDVEIEHQHQTTGGGTVARMCPGSAFERVADGRVDDVRTCKSQRGGRRVKQSRPMRAASRDDVDFRGVICRFVMSFDGRQTQLNISTEFRLERRSCRPRRRAGLRSRTTDFQSDSDSVYSSAAGSTPSNTSSPTSYLKPASAAARKTCASCHVNKTPLWRDAEDGTPLCNACGIRYKKYRLRCPRCWHIPRKQWTLQAPSSWRRQTSRRCQKCGHHQAQQQQQQQQHVQL